MTLEVKSTKWFPRTPSKNAQLVVETCPGYNEAKARALEDYYEEKHCKNCALRVKFDPSIRQLKINGLCPKK